MKQVHPGLRRKLAKQTRLIDATKVKLSGLSADWSRFSDDLCAAKMHIVYDPNEACPVTAEITPDNINDVTPAKAMQIEPASPMSLILLTMTMVGGKNWMLPVVALSPGAGRAPNPSPTISCR